MPEAPVAGSDAAAPAGSPRIRLGAIVALAFAAGFVALLATGNGGPSSPAPAVTTTTAVQPEGPVATSPGALARLAATLHQPIYWAGRRPAVTYELTRTANGSIYVRYLPKGVAIGDPRSSFLVVATYPYVDAFDALQGVAGQDGIAIPNGGLALANATNPNDVHVAFPGDSVQIEVYGGSPGEALEAARTGVVRPVG